MVVVALAVLFLVVIVAGEWADARVQRRYAAGGRPIRSRDTRLPDPLVPSTIQRSSGGG